MSVRDETYSIPSVQKSNCWKKIFSLQMSFNESTLTNDAATYDPTYAYKSVIASPSLSPLGLITGAVQWCIASNIDLEVESINILAVFSLTTPCSKEQSAAHTVQFSASTISNIGRLNPSQVHIRKVIQHMVFMNIIITINFSYIFFSCLQKIVKPFFIGGEPFVFIKRVCNASFLFTRFTTMTWGGFVFRSLQSHWQDILRSFTRDDHCTWWGRFTVECCWAPCTLSPCNITLWCHLEIITAQAVLNNGNIDVVHPYQDITVSVMWFLQDQYFSHLFSYDLR